MPCLPEPLTDPREIQAALAEFFEPYEVKHKPQAVSGNRALVASFIDARCVMDRLDDVMGVAGWRDSYSAQANGTVLCRLELLINGEWIGKEDVGGQSAQPDSGDRDKSAFSNALKRAAVKWGIGRYLYALKLGWLDYDPVKKQFVRPPAIPDRFLPRAHDRAPVVTQKQQPPAAPVVEVKQQRPSLWDRVLGFESLLVKKAKCNAGDLVDHLAEELKDRIPGHPSTWGEQYSTLVEKTCREFKDMLDGSAELANGTAATNGAA